MNCWKLNCSDEPAFFCPCSDVGIYSCQAHITEHLLIRAKKGHNPEALSFNQNPETVIALCNYLRKRNNELINFQCKIVANIMQKIKELNFQLEVSIDEIKWVKNNNWALLQQIISHENLPNNDEIKKILTFEPDEALKNIQNKISRIDKTKLPKNVYFDFDNDGYSIEGNEINIFRHNTKELIRVNLSDLTCKDTTIAMEQNTDTYLSMCKLPDNSIFCFGGDTPFSASSFIINPDNSIKYLANRSQPCGYSSAIYYQNEIYAFGGSDDNGFLLVPEKYNILENKWTELPQMSAGANCYSGFAYRDEIFFAGFHHTKVYVYHISQNKYSKISIPLTKTNKILLLNQKNFYVIESDSKIFEIDIDDFSQIKIVGNSLDFVDVVSHIVEFGHFAYFMDAGSNLYKFDLAGKSVEKLKEI